MSSRSVLDRDMRAVRDDILRAFSLLSVAIDRALQAFESHDEEFAQLVVSEDDAIDELHVQIEEQVLKTFALQQPMARDLRRLIADLLISNELERMADHATGVAKAALRYTGNRALEVPPIIHLMKDRAKHMLDEIVDAYIRMDADKAREVALLDDEIDALYQELFNMVITQMTSGQMTVEEGTYLLWAGHNLERIGDRATNISERIVYARSGGIYELNLKPHEREESAQD